MTAAIQAGTRRSRDRRVLIGAIVLVVVLSIVSLFIGVSDVSLGDVLSGDRDKLDIFFTSRVPRTIAILLAGSAMAVAGLTMQALTRNRFVAPSTAGTLDAASLGLVVGAILVPGAAIGVKMLIAVVFAIGGTGIFLVLLQRLEFRDIIVVPLMGVMLGAVFNAGAVFLADRRGLLQSLMTWTSGDFSGTLRGRYELLYVVAVLSVLVYWFADRFTLAGLGRDFAVNVGLEHRRTVMLGMVLVATSSAVVVVVAGSIPLLGLVVPNLVTYLLGDQLRRVLPLTALAGALALLVADIGSRTIRAPYEVPVGTVLGVVGGAAFLVMLMRSRGRHA